MIQVSMNDHSDGRMENHAIVLFRVQDAPQNEKK